MSDTERVGISTLTRLMLPQGSVFTLLGEGTFHQVHGGAATGLSKPKMDEKFQEWLSESRALNQAIAPEIIPNYEFILAGHMPPECASWLARNAAAQKF